MNVLEALFAPGTRVIRGRVAGLVDNIPPDAIVLAGTVSGPVDELPADAIVLDLEPREPDA